MCGDTGTVCGDTGTVTRTVCGGDTGTVCAGDTDGVVVIRGQCVVVTLCDELHLVVRRLPVLGSGRGALE